MILPSILRNRACRWSLLVVLVAGLGPSASASWRSKMFPEGWRPVDEGVQEGLNIFYDTRGTQDLYGHTVSEGHPAYHPYRYLHDFSYAGYHKGERPIPPQDPTWVPEGKVYDVTQPPYNCIPDGQRIHDCRPGIQQAVLDAEAAGGGVIYLPAGEYHVTSASTTEFIRIRKGNIVVRGDGAGLTRIKVDPYRSGRFEMHRKSVFRVTGGSCWTDDAKKSSTRTAIVADLIFPTRVIPVRNASLFSPNDPIVIRALRNDAFIAEHDMQGTWAPGTCAYLFRRTVVSVDRSANTVEIDVPTRYRIRKADAAEVIKVSPGISEVGFESFSVGMIRHPDEWKWSGDIIQARDSGRVPILHDIWQARIFDLNNLSDGWLHEIESYRPDENIGRYPSNAMTGKRFGNYEVEILNEVIWLNQTRNITLRSLHFRNAQVDYGSSNGYSVRIMGNDNLLDDVAIEKCKKAFCLTDCWSNGNVVKDSLSKNSFASGDLYHWSLSMANLVDNHTLDGPYWSAIIEAVGSIGHGHSTAQSVFWNMRGLRTPDTGIKTVLDRDNDGDGIPDNNEKHGDLPDVGLVISNQYDWGYIIGTQGPYSRVLTPHMQRAVNGDYARPATFPVDYSEGIGYDTTSVGSLEPRSLYEAQLAIRLGEPPTSGGEEPPVEIIVDNGGPGSSYTGAWKSSGGSKPYGKNSVYSRTANSRYKFSVQVPRADQYDVYLWWTTYASRVTQVPVEIRGSDGQLLDTVLVNQRFDGGQWNYIGTWELNGAASITVVSTTSQGSTCADAVRVVTGQPLPPPEVAPLLPAGGIVDNGQDGTWSMGKWKISGALHPYGRNSLSASEDGSVYAYRLGLPREGKYDVSLWWTTESDRGSRVPVEVTHAGGTTTVYVDQRQGGGKWNYVGTWDFGSSILVRIVSDGILGSTCADAVRIRRSTRLLRPLGLQQSP